MIGPGGALFVGPTIAVVGYSVILVAPLLGLVRVLKVLDNSCDYSIQNTARQALFLPTSREAKYKAKAAIDAFFMRFGDVLQAGIVYAGHGFAICRVIVCRAQPGVHGGLDRPRHTPRAGI